MKIFTFTFLFFLSLNSFAQTSSTTNTIEFLDLKPTLKAGSVMLQWPVAHIDNSATWEIQGSVDGQSFQTIGFVWGAENEKTDNCIFKQAVKKLESKFTYYRVIKEIAVPGKELAKL